MSLARLAENVDVDLWNYQTADGRSIRKAFDYLLPYALGEKKWTGQQIAGWSPRGHVCLAAPGRAQVSGRAISSNVLKITGMRCRRSR